jgi:hypothetical protein
MLKLSDPCYLATGVPTHQNSPRLIARVNCIAGKRDDTAVSPWLFAVSPTPRLPFRKSLPTLCFKSNRARPFLDGRSRWSSEQIVRLFLVPESLLTCSHESTTWPCPEQVWSNHSLTPLFKQHCRIIPPLNFYVYLQVCFLKIVRPVFYMYFWCVRFVLYFLTASLCIKSITVVRAGYHVAGQDLSAIDNSDKARRGTAWLLQCSAWRTRPLFFHTTLEICECNLRCVNALNLFPHRTQELHW